jgi:hypothetical protein
MSPSEVAHRLQEHVKRSSLRRDGSGWGRFDVGDGALSVLEPLRRGFEAPWPDDVLLETRTAAEAILAGNITLLGQFWPIDSVRHMRPELWFIDPTTGKLWPGADAYCFDVNYRHCKGLGDVKFVWELNRLQFLQPLAALALHDRDTELYERVLTIVLSWMDANPPFRGINWPSGIELAMRLVTIAIVVACAPSEDNISPQKRRSLRSFVAAHAFWLARYPSLYSSANNHLVAEGLGLLIATLLVPDLPDAARLDGKARSILASAPIKQFHSDGTGVEQSPTYAAFTLEMIVLAATLTNGEWLSTEARQRLLSVGYHLKTLMDGAGRVPRIGDDDEGRVIALPPAREARYAASVVAGLSSLLGEDSVAPPACAPHLRDLVYSSNREGTAAPLGTTTYRSGGYTVVREKIGKRNMLLVFDHGPLGHLSIAAHGHADALALWLHLDNQPILVDAGTYLYHSGAGWREHFRSTAAHNTLEIDGQSQSLTSGAFNWRHKALAELVGQQEGPNWSFTATHNGYIKRFGVEHRRTIRRSERGFEIDDELHGKEVKKPVVIRYLLNPVLTAHKTEKGVVIRQSGQDLLTFSSQPHTSVEIIRGESADSFSIYSPTFGAKEAATSIIVTLPAAKKPKITSSFLIHEH